MHKCKSIFGRGSTERLPANIDGFVKMILVSVAMESSQLLVQLLQFVYDHASPRHGTARIFLVLFE